MYQIDESSNISPDLYNLSFVQFIIPTTFSSSLRYIKVPSYE